MPRLDPVQIASSLRSYPVRGLRIRPVSCLAQVRVFESISISSIERSHARSVRADAGGPLRARAFPFTLGLALCPRPAPPMHVSLPLQRVRAGSPRRAPRTPRAPRITLSRSVRILTCTATRCWRAISTFSWIRRASQSVQDPPSRSPLPELPSVRLKNALKPAVKRRVLDEMVEV
jgi:hypothetical protein